MPRQRLAVSDPVPSTPLARTGVANGSVLVVAYRLLVKVINNSGQNGPLSVVATDLDTGVEISLIGDALFDRALSASYFDKTYAVSKTKMAEIFTGAVRIPFTVSFMNADGNERVLTGWRTDSTVNNLGQSMVEDLNIPANESRLRTVTHDRINWLIVNGVKFVVE